MKLLILQIKALYFGSFATSTTAIGPRSTRWLPSSGRNKGQMLKCPILLGQYSTICLCRQATYVVCCPIVWGIIVRVQWPSHASTNPCLVFLHFAPPLHLPFDLYTIQGTTLLSDTCTHIMSTVADLQHAQVVQNRLKP